MKIHLVIHINDKDEVEVIKADTNEDLIMKVAGDKYTPDYWVTTAEVELTKNDKVILGNSIQAIERKEFEEIIKREKERRELYGVQGEKKL